MVQVVLCAAQRWMLALGTSRQAVRKPQQLIWGEATWGGTKALGPQSCEGAFLEGGPPAQLRCPGVV